MAKFPYKALEEFVFRTPLLSLSFIKHFLEKKDINESNLKSIFSDPLFQEAVFLASPNLYKILKEWLEGKIYDKIKIEKLQLSLLKYLSRMSTRSTPFGLFAGYSLGKFDTATDITLNHFSDYKRYTRLDMQYLLMLSQTITNNPNLRNTLKFSPNTSLYKIGKQYRYIEYKYSSGLKRTHQIQAIENDIYFEFIINKAKRGKTISDLVDSLIKLDPEVNFSEAIHYINSLIENQILISEIDSIVVGNDYFSTIKNKINSYETSRILENISRKLSKIDSQIPNSIDNYHEIKTIAENLKTDIDLKYFFQTDCRVSTSSCKLEKKILKDVKDGIIFLNKLSIISKSSSNTHLENFIKKFKTRYEGQTIPLTKALDPETGIGYKNSDMSDIIPDDNFIDDLIIPQKNSNKSEIHWTNVNSILHYKITQAYKSGDYIIKFNTNDLPDWIEEKWEDLPDTLSFMVEIIKIQGYQKIKIDGAGGASGANLFGRFCLNDPEILNHTKVILDIEKDINQDYIIAELSHLPESRIGNVISRPSFTEYEIPYLAQSIKPIEKQILIDDLMISVKGNDIILFSKRLNSKVLPRLINAHNYSLNSIPIYHFLCDLQNQGKRSGIGLDLGVMGKNYKFIPRMELGNIILKPATWNLRKKDIEIFTENPKSDSELLDACIKMREKWKLPRFILLAENDNELFINLENIKSIKMMLDAIGQRSSFIFKEFLFTDDEQIIRRGEEYYTNQIIITFYNNQKLLNIKND